MTVNNLNHNTVPTPSATSSIPVASVAPAPTHDRESSGYRSAMPPTTTTESQNQALQAMKSSAESKPEELIIYGHSPLFYWWPVWVVGFVIAALTYTSGQSFKIGPDHELYYVSSNAGILFFLTLSIVLLITNVSLRGLASVITIMGIALTSFILAYYHLWDAIFGWFGQLRIHLNLGAYFWFSTLLFLVWALAFFVFDRLEYWRVRPGQVVREFAWGAGSKSYDTENMVLEKHRDDLFRHWILGLGSGDLQVMPYGADREVLNIPNVLFVGEKIRRMQEMIAMEPEAKSN